MLNQHVVAIGGSAGSLESLKRFFDHTPLNDASYIVLRHLPADYRSMLNVLLHNHSKLDVLEAKQGMPVSTNKVYFAPPHYYLTVKDGRFDLLQRTAELYNDAIDIFLLSLAQNENNKKAVAVILSGKGSDGRKGAEAIKKAGGLVIVQTPESCEFNSMPQQVIDSGYADFVLLPEDMAPVIQGYVNQAFSKNKADE